jgi:parallel beta-helix repeat protein
LFSGCKPYVGRRKRLYLVALSTIFVVVLSFIVFTCNNNNSGNTFLFVSTAQAATETLASGENNGTASPSSASHISCGSTLSKPANLTSDIGPCREGDGLIIGANNIRLDCNGFSIKGDTSGNTVGIRLERISGVTIENCKVLRFERGFLLDSSFNNTLVKNTATTNSDGFALQYSSANNTLVQNTAGNNFHGFTLTHFSSNNALTENTAIGNNDVGFLLDSSSFDNSLTQNTAANCRHGFTLFSSSNNTLSGNTAAKNTGVAFFVDSFSYNNTLTANSAIGNNGTGFQLDSSSSHNILTDNTACAILSAFSSIPLPLITRWLKILPQKTISEASLFILLSIIH